MALPLFTMLPIYDPVCVLLEKPFSTWQKDVKNEFLNCEKPTPRLDVRLSYKRNFRGSWYTDFVWLCGSYYLNKLFCLPCLVTSIKTSIWNKNGFSDFGNVSRALGNHESSSEHLRCAFAFEKLIKNLVPAPAVVPPLKPPNKAEKKYCNLLNIKLELSELKKDIRKEQLRQEQIKRRILEVELKKALE